MMIEEIKIRLERLEESTEIRSQNNREWCDGVIEHVEELEGRLDKILNRMAEQIETLETNTSVLFKRIDVLEKKRIKQEKYIEARLSRLSR